MDTKQREFFWGVIDRLERAANPETEEDYICLLNVLIFLKAVDAIGDKVVIICRKFNVGHPSCKELAVGQKSFEQWYRETRVKAGYKENYPADIFEKISL